ncbi:MAG: transmembrane domain-containing protein [Oscillospiraceae bacterium]|nr:transmembrane domain-containing protein [Oscillospiraceae bacterium]
MNIALTAELQSRFAPLPKNIHIFFCIIATIVFLALYIRKHRIVDFLWLFVCDLPLILQFYADSTTAAVIGVCEVILLVAIFVFWLQDRKAAKNQAQDDSESKDDSGDADDLKDVEQAVKVERSKLAGNEADDNVISQAFDGFNP